jgi:hypothetical protein
MWREATGFYERAVQLDPNLQLLGRGFPRAHALIYFGRAPGMTLAARGDTAKRALRMRRNWSRTHLRPCSP